MNQPSLPRSEQGETAGIARITGEMPLISRHERDFWRRAVDEQRARLELATVTASAGSMPGAS